MTREQSSGGGRTVLDAGETRLPLLVANLTVAGIAPVHQNAKRVAEAILYWMMIGYLATGRRIVIDGQHEVRLDGWSLSLEHRRDCYPVTECGI